MYTQDHPRQRQAGFSLLEVMVAVSITSVTLVGLAVAIANTVQSNDYREDQTVCFKAAHETMEMLLSLDMDTMLLQNGNTFAIGSPDAPLRTGAANGVACKISSEWAWAMSKLRSTRTISLADPARAIA